jgi:hypothetical protein
LFKKVVERFFQSGTRYLDGHVIEHIALEIQKAVWTQDLVELARLKHLGPTMLFSVTPKRTLAFRRKNAVAIAESLIRELGDDLKRFTKCEKSENVFARTILGNYRRAVSETSLGSD